MVILPRSSEPSLRGCAAEQERPVSDGRPYISSGGVAGNFDDGAQPGTIAESGAGMEEAALGGGDGDIQQLSRFLHGSLLQLTHLDNGADTRAEAADGVAQ